MKRTEEDGIGWIDTEMLQKEYNGKPVKFPGIVSPNRVTVQALRDSVKGRDVSVCSIFCEIRALPQQNSPA